MIIKQTDKLKPDGYWHEGRQVNIQRIYGGIAFKGMKKFVCLLGEESFFGQTHYFIIAEGETEPGESVVDILDVARRMEGLHSVQRWFGKIDSNIKQTIALTNKMLYNTGIRNILVSDVPGTGEWIDEAISIVHKLTTGEDKRLHFYNESMIVSELKALPTRDIRIEDYPRATALSNVVGGMLRYSHEIVRPEDLCPEPEGDY